MTDNKGKDRKHFSPDRPHILHVYQTLKNGSSHSISHPLEILLNVDNDAEPEEIRPLVYEIHDENPPSPITPPNGTAPPPEPPIEEGPSE